MGIITHDGGDGGVVEVVMLLTVGRVHESFAVDDSGTQSLHAGALVFDGGVKQVTGDPGGGASDIGCGGQRVHQSLVPTPRACMQVR